MGARRASSITFPRYHGALSMTSTARRCPAAGYTWRRGTGGRRTPPASAAPSTSRSAVWHPSGGPPGWRAAEAQLTTANTCIRCLQSHVPTTGRCPFTPRVAVRGAPSGPGLTGTAGRGSPPLRLFESGQLLPCLRLPGRVAAEQAVRADAVPRPERLEGRLAHLRAPGLVQVVSQFGYVQLARSNPYLAGPSITHCRSTGARSGVSLGVAPSPSAVAGRPTRRLGSRSARG